MGMNNTELDWDNINLNYEGENKFASFFSSQGNIHTYPAKAVPEMVRDLMIKISSLSNIKSVLDPFVGSGTTALECKYLGIDFYGSDLNPLAVLLARTKSLTIKNTYYTKKHLLEFADIIHNDYIKTHVVPLITFDNINFWFKPKNIRELSYIKLEIDNFLKKSKTNRTCYALVLLTALSSTIRKVSLSRNSEFKLYRLSKNDMEKFDVNAMEVFKDVIKNLLDMLVVANNTYTNDTRCDIFLKNAKNIDYLGNQQVDMIITSPPYGDSRSTVAYGQFSKLSLQWMSDLMWKYLRIPMDQENCDELLLGGRKSDWSLDDLTGFQKSNILNQLLLDIDIKTESKRKELLITKSLLLNIMNKASNNLFLVESDIKENNMLYKLIYERIRLDIYRKINNAGNRLDNKSIKVKAKEQTDKCISEFCDKSNKSFYKRQQYIAKRLCCVLDTINRNFDSISKRKSEIVLFFQDLYKVVIETDRILKNNGFQIWIVGHRTVLGNVNINMEGILKEWFSELGYCFITSLERKYSFKRMPQHINSTIERNEPVSTMMNEYILVVQK
jgi:hypothetical protein